MSISDDKRNWDNLKQVLQRAKKLEVAVGILEGSKGPKGVNIAEYATYNEFGTAKIPARPFMAISFDTHKKTIEADIDKAMGEVLAGKRTPEQALTIVGLKHADRIKNTITGPNIPPPLSPVTVARKKGSTKTLVDTGALVNSVQIEVRAVK